LTVSRSRPVRLSSAKDIDTLPRDGALKVVLSAQLVRYLVLPWSAALGSENEWLAFARHAFSSTYGAEAASWRIRVAGAESGKARVACAMDSALYEALRALPNVVSIQPELMGEFNERRPELAAGCAWFVLRESGRLTLCLICDGDWKLVRSRRIDEDWRAALPRLIARETAASGEPACERIVLCNPEA
jgi:hypothetical protein